MRFVIDRNQGPAGFEKVLESITTEDSRYSTAIEALKDNVITPFNPDHKGEKVEFEDVRPTFAIAKLPADHQSFSDGWTCTAICPEEGFDD